MGFGTVFLLDTPLGILADCTVASIRNPKTCTLNLKSQTLTLNPNPRILNPKPPP